MKEYILFSPYKMGSIALSNRIVMAPMTRCRAIDNIPTPSMETYYSQRATAGLIITEGTAPSANGLGYARIPGIFSTEQMFAWKKIVDSVHDEGSKIFLQIMHTGRISHPLNMPENSIIFAPSAVKAKGQMWTDQKGMQDYMIPMEMSISDISNSITEFVIAAENAMLAGFDGVEIHGANGYLVEQFLSPETNLRSDNYGGGFENRCRYLLELVEAVAAGVGRDRVGIRLSPFGTANDMPVYDEIESTYEYLAKQLNKLAIAYIHLVDHSSMGTPVVPQHLTNVIRHHFKKTVILSGGYTKEKAEVDLLKKEGDLVAFAKLFINNPDLVDRFKNNLPLSDNLATDLFYTNGEEGYTDYPTYKHELV
jgi:N-ethylmaleimide reductase